MATRVIHILLILTTATLTSGLKIDFSNSRITQLHGQLAVNNFLQTDMQQIRAIYFYKSDVKFLNFFFRELIKATEYLDMYSVKAGFCNCTEKVNSDVKECGQEKVEMSLHTYRQGLPLLSLELETMFDVNSILSNILQLVLLREVPILQNPQEVKKYLNSLRGKQDVIFGHMKAIGTFDHRVFMEVAYAYMDKLKFVVCTDKKATQLFEQPPEDFDGSSIWWIWTKTMSTQDTHFHNIRYKGELSLKAVARFALATTLPKMFDIPVNGLQHPYEAVDLPMIIFFYDSNCMESVYQRAHEVTKYYGGKATVLLVNMDREEAKKIYTVPGQIPAVSIVHKKGEAPYFFREEFTSDNVTLFLELQLAQPMYPQTESIREEEREVYTEHEEMDSNLPRRPPDMDIEAVERQDDKVANAVEKTKRVPMLLDLVPALTDKTFPSVVKEASIAVILFYFPIDAVSMGYLRMFGEAVDMLGKDTTLHIARVNCYDWTDVCKQDNITYYPTLRVYNNGKMVWDFQGPQDTGVFYSTLKLLDMSLPQYVTDKEKVTKYILYHEDQRAVTNVSLLGFFTKDNINEKQIFQEFARNASIKNRIFSVYTDIKDVVDIARMLEMKVPGVIMIKSDDKIEPLVKFDQEFNEQNLQNFVEMNILPRLGVLTPLMFPEIRRRYSDMTILFTDGSTSCQEHEHVLKQIVEARHFRNISFSKMTVPSNNSVGYKVLKKYTVEPRVPHISFVRLQKGEVYNYVHGEINLSALSKWLTDVLDGAVQPSTMLTDTQWKPLNKGYEFLRIMDWEREQERKMSIKKMESDSNLEESLDEMRFRQDSIEDLDESDTRKDLIDLNKSRLYHHAPGRGGHHVDHMHNEGPGMGPPQKTHLRGAQTDDRKHKMPEVDQTVNVRTSSGSPKKHDPSEL